MFGYLNCLMATSKKIIKISFDSYSNEQLRRELSQKHLIRHINLKLNSGVTNQHTTSEVSMFFTPLYVDFEPLYVDLAPYITKPHSLNDVFS